MIINKIKLVLLAAAFLCIGTNKAQNLEWGFNVGNFDTDSWSGGELKSNGDLVVYGFIYGGDLNPLGAPMQAQGGNLINTYNSQGELVQSLPITADIRIKDLKLDADNNMLVLASYQASNVDIDFGTGTNYIQLVDSSNYRNCYIAKYAPNGDLIWAKPFNYPYMISLNMLRIATDAAGNAYLAGTFGNGLNDNFDVDFDAAVYNIRTLGLQDLFLTKYDANDGHFLWGFNIGVPPQCWTGNCNAEEVYMEGLAVDADGNAYITAHFGDSLDIDPNPNNIVGFNALNVATALLKYNSNGNLVWGRHIGQNTAATTLKLSARANNGDLFLNYFCASSTDLDPSANVVYPSLNAFRNFVIARYDQNGNYLWHHTLTDNGDISMNAYTGNNGEYFIEFVNLGIADTILNVDFINNAAPCLINATHSAVAKYDANNNFISVWRRERNFMFDLLVDAADNIFALGYVDSSNCNFDWQGDSVANFTDFGLYDAYIAKYSPNSPIAVTQTANTDLLVFPNPTNGFINIQLPEAATVQIFNLHGQLISSQIATSATLQRVDVSNLPNAVYTLKVISDKGQIYTQKIVKY